MSEPVIETVVTAPVDAAAPVVEATPAADSVVTPIVDDKPDNVGEAIKKEVDRREALLIAKYEQEGKTNAQKARDSLIAEEDIEWNGKKVTTEAEYKQMLREAEITKQYKDKQLPEEIVQELVDAKKFRDEVEPELKQNRTEKKQTADFKAFFEAYPTIDPKDVPQSVWVDYAAGKDLIDTYAKHENAILKQKLADLEKQKQVEQQNKENAEAATGSVIGQGTAVVANFTREQVAAMSKEEMKAHYPAVIASMKAWKK